MQHVLQTTTRNVKTQNNYYLYIPQTRQGRRSWSTSKYNHRQNYIVPNLKDAGDTLEFDGKTFCLTVLNIRFSFKNRNQNTTPKRNHAIDDARWCSSQYTSFMTHSSLYGPRTWLFLKHVSLDFAFVLRIKMSLVQVRVLLGEIRAIVHVLGRRTRQPMRSGCYNKKEAQKIGTINDPQ